MLTPQVPSWPQGQQHQPSLGRTWVEGLLPTATVPRASGWVECCGKLLPPLFQVFLTFFTWFLFLACFFVPGAQARSESCPSLPSPPVPTKLLLVTRVWQKSYLLRSLVSCLQPNKYVFFVLSGMYGMCGLWRQKKIPICMKQNTCWALEQ